MTTVHQPPIPLGPFEVGQAPVITADVINLPGGTGVSTACSWRVKDPEGAIVSVSSPHPSINNPDDNVWTYQMETIDQEGIYWVKCQTTEGLLAAKTVQVAVTPDPYT